MATKRPQGETPEQRVMRKASDLRTALGGSLVKYKSLIIGVKDKPRHAVFLGFRDRRDT